MSMTQRVAPKPDTWIQHTFNEHLQGHEVGEMSRTTAGFVQDLGFGNCVEDIPPTLGSQTDLRGGVPECNQLYARVDILKPRQAQGKSLPQQRIEDMVEVKSSTDVKDENIADVAFARHVVKSCGVTVNRCFLVCLILDQM